LLSPVNPKTDAKKRGHITIGGQCAWAAGFAIAATLDPGQSTDAHI
jgi:hypothetical protein